MKILFMLLCLCMMARASHAQNYGIKGSVADTAIRQKLRYASIILLNAKDSVLRQFTFSKAEGEFRIDRLPEGKYLLLVSHPGYADFTETFTLGGALEQHDFGEISLQLRSRVLQEVIIKAKVPLSAMKGDTTEFNVKNLIIRPNDRVEDLLKQIPGLRVDRYGKITAFGQAVNKVLVDGEEFFADDPTLVTRNIRADMVQKIQLYDKKSDQAKFSGIDDAKMTKTLDIQLREDKKRGYFGRLAGGKGTDQYYEGQGFYNRFETKKKAAVYATAANTGITGLGWEENNKLGTAGGNVSVIDASDLVLYDTNNDEMEFFNGRYNGEGLPTAYGGGAHYDEKWAADRKALNANLKTGWVGVKGSKNNFTQLNLAQNTIETNTGQRFDDGVYRTRFDALYTEAFNPSMQLKLAIDATKKSNHSQHYYMTESRNATNQLLNMQSRQLKSDGNSQFINASLLLMKRFKKNGRALSLNLIGANNRSNTDGYLASNINFYQLAEDSTVQIDQHKTTEVQNQVLNAKVTYSEPLSKSMTAVGTYSVISGSGFSDWRTFDRDIAGNEQVNNLLSNDYRLKQVSHQPGIMFLSRGNKWMASAGTLLSFVHYRQEDLFTGSELSRNFLNWNPQASFQYRFSTQRSLRLNYLGSNIQPSIVQIQPIITNTDPLNLVIGNANLRPAFNHRLSGEYNSFNVSNNRSLHINGYYQAVRNAIVSSVATDQSGKAVYRFINLNAKDQISLLLSGAYNQKWAGPELNIGTGLTINGNTAYNDVNGELNKIIYNNYTVQLNLSKNKAKAYEFIINAGLSYIENQASLQPQLNNSGMALLGSGSVSFDLPAHITASFDGNYEYRARTTAFREPFDRLTLNAVLKKYFMKNDPLKVSISGNDLLNQNKGFYQNTNGAIFNRSTFTTITRLFLFSITYEFNHMGNGGSLKK